MKTFVRILILVAILEALSGCGRARYANPLLPSEDPTLSVLNESSGPVILYVVQSGQRWRLATIDPGRACLQLPSARGSLYLAFHSWNGDGSTTTFNPLEWPGWQIRFDGSSDIYGLSLVPADRCKL